MIHLCARILSVLTQNPSFCQALQSKEPHWPLHIAHAIERHLKHAESVVRFLFAVGNGAAAIPKMGTKFLKTVRRVMSHYAKKLGGKNTFKIERDVILKSIRVCANYAMWEEGANAIANDKHLRNSHLAILKLATEGKLNEDKEEMLKYVIASLNNVIYFSSVDFKECADEISPLFIKVRKFQFQRKVKKVFFVEIQLPCYIFLGY